MAKNEVVKREVTALAIPKAELDEMFGESSLDVSTGLSFNTIKIVRETAQFDLGNESYEKTLTGHILFKHRANQWWEVPFDERSEDDDPAPQCYSIDGIKPCGGSKMVSELCCGCPNDVFGSDSDGRGKACRNTMRFLFLQDNAVIPVVLVAPPTSLSKKGSLQHWLNGVPNEVSAAYTAIDVHNSKGGPVVDYWPAHVELSLEKATFKGDMTASLLCVKTLDIVTPKSNPSKIRQLFQMMKETSEMYKAEQESYVLTETVETDSEDKGNGSSGDDDIPI